MAKFPIQCDHCSSVLSVPESTIGKKVRCPKCQGIILVATKDADTAESPSKSLPPLGPKIDRKSVVNKTTPPIPERTTKEIDVGTEQAGVWAKHRVLITTGCTALLTVFITIFAIVFVAANHTPEDERLFLVGTWLIHSDADASGILKQMESQDEVQAMNKEQKELLFAAVEAKYQESLSNLTLELQRDGVAIMTVPKINENAKVTTGTWEVAGSGPDLKLRLNIVEKGIWVPIRFDSDNQFKQIFESSTQIYIRKR